MNVTPIKNFFARFESRHDHDEPAEKQCGNCNTQIIGNFCHVCGQSAHVHHSLIHLLEEMAHGLWHFDAKGWRTIPLLIAYPGELTRRYIDGQRVRFISPLGLYLFMVFFMFFVFSMTAEHGVGVDPTTIRQEAHKSLGSDLAKAKETSANAQNELDEAKKTGGDIAGKQQALDKAIKYQESIESDLSNFDKFTGGSGASPLALDNKHVEVKGFGQDPEKLKANLKHAIDNPELTLYKMKNNGYKFALLLVPLSMPILWLMFFWKRNVTMFDHAVFTLYSLSFMAFLFSVIGVLFTERLDGIAMLLTFAAPPVHMYLQLKGTYQLSTFSALWRTWMLAFAAATMILIYFLLIVILSAA